MKNKNDDLKEKEIMSEEPLKQDKLENVSGGGSYFGFIPYFNPELCKGQYCEKAKCADRCPGEEGAIVITTITLYGNNYYIAGLNENKCKRCLFCNSMSDCPNGVIKFSK